MTVSGPPPIFTTELKDSALKITDGLALGCQGILIHMMISIKPILTLLAILFIYFSGCSTMA